MNPFELDKGYREALGAFEGFRKLGFSSDDIYFTVGGQAPASHPEGPGRQVVIVLKAQGKRFNIVVGFVADDADSIERTWVEFATAVNDGQVSQEHLDRLWQESMIHNDAAGFLIALVGKGFTLPRTAAKLLN